MQIKSICKEELLDTLVEDKFMLQNNETIFVKYPNNNQLFSKTVNI